MQPALLSYRVQQEGFGTVTVGGKFENRFCGWLPGLQTYSCFIPSLFLKVYIYISLKTRLRIIHVQFMTF